MADIFDDYSMSGAMFEAWDEMFERPGQPRLAVPVAVRRAAAAGAGRSAVPGRPAGPGLHRPGRHVRLRGRGAAVPARPDPPHPRRRRVGPADRAPSSSGSRRSRRSSPTSTAPGEVFTDGVVPRQLITTSAHFHRAGARHRAGQRGAGAHQRRRPDPRRGRASSASSRTTCASRPACRYVIENRRAMTHTLPALFAEARVHAGRRLPGPAAGGAAGRRAGGRRRPVRGRAHARASTTRPTSSTRCSPG